MKFFLDNLGNSFSPFITLNISCHYLLACNLSAETSVVDHMGFPFYVTCCLSFASLIFFHCVQFLLVLFLCVSSHFFLLYPVWDFLCFLDVIDSFLSHVRNVFNYNLFKFFLFLFSSSEMLIS